MTRKRTFQKDRMTRVNFLKLDFFKETKRLGGMEL